MTAHARRGRLLAFALAASCAVGLSCACARRTSPAAPAPVDAGGNPADDLAYRRAAALAEIAKARTAALSETSRAVSLPSLERLVEDADAVLAHVTSSARDHAFVRRSLETARAYADVLLGGEDPYDYARGVMVKAYRSEWDHTLQPYALYVPRDYDPARAWPLIVALHGAGSNHRHNLRRAFGIDNRPGETDEEASRNDVPFPDVPALVVAPYGRGEYMGYDGLGEQDVLRVLADVRRAYRIDADRISLTGLSMGGGGTWTIGLRHPELFAALAPVCGVTDVRTWIAPEDAALYDQPLLDAMSPVAIAQNAAHMRVFIFHGDADDVVPVSDSRRMAERYRALGWLGKTVTYTEYPGVKHNAWIPAYRDAQLLRTLAAVKRDPKARPVVMKAIPQGHPVPGLFGKSLPRERPHLYVHGTGGTPAAVASARGLAQALADWGPGVSARFTVKADRDLTADDKQSFDLVLVGQPAPELAWPALKLPAGLTLGAPTPWFRAVIPSPFAAHHAMLVLGASGPDGFAKLARLAHPNREVWAPETNRDVVTGP